MSISQLHPGMPRPRCVPASLVQLLLFVSKHIAIAPCCTCTGSDMPFCTMVSKCSHWQHPQQCPREALPQPPCLRDRRGGGPGGEGGGGVVVMLMARCVSSHVKQPSCLAAHKTPCSSVPQTHTYSAHAQGTTGLDATCHLPVLQGTCVRPQPEGSRWTQARTLPAPASHTDDDGGIGVGHQARQPEAEGLGYGKQGCGCENPGTCLGSVVLVALLHMPPHLNATVSSQPFSPRYGCGVVCVC